MSGSFSDVLDEALQKNPEEIIWDFSGKSFYSRSDIAAMGEDVMHYLDMSGVPRDASIGIVVRNRPLHGAIIVGLLARGISFTTIYAFQSPSLLARDIVESQFACVIADVDDWHDELHAAVAVSGTIGLVLNHQNPTIISQIETVPHFSRAAYHQITGGGIELLSSGTTGKPKRINFPFQMISRAMETVLAGQLDDSKPADICTWPFAGIGGLCNLVANVVINRYMTLLDRFNVDDWVAAVRRHRPSYVSGPPTVARMIVDAEVAPEDLSSIKYFYGGSAPMPDQLADELFSTYGITTIWAYGATEFFGTIISWNIPLHETYGNKKKGSMGKALPGVEVRIVDDVTGNILGAGEVGNLEARVNSIGDRWIRTTDLAAMDVDGFVYHHGRGDGAIIRGGFKILPETIVNAMVKHPAVLDAVVVGIDDERLGQVPFAVVELRRQYSTVTAQSLMCFLREELISTAIPVKIIILDEIPRTPSLKADLSKVKALFPR